MNRQYFYMLFFMLLATIPTTIAPMRSATFSVPFKNANNRFASTTQNQPLSQKTTVQIPIESSNESLAQVIQDQQQDQSSSNQSKWYQGKKWKYFTGLGTGAATAIALEKAQAYSKIEDQRAIMQRLQAELAKLEQEFADLGGDLKRVFNPEGLKNFGTEDLEYKIHCYQRWINKRKDFLNQSVDVQVFDPELYALFLKIKNDLGITENIEFRIVLDDEFIHPAAYNPMYQSIKFMKDYKKIDKSLIIYLLSHELEHLRQYLHYPGSYQIPSDEEFTKSLNLGEQSPTGIHLKAEAGADANAMGYFDCPECLKYNAADRKTLLIAQHKPRDLPSGYFTTTLGYFSPEDYEPYIERACKEGEQCLAHKTLGKPKEIDTAIPQNFDSFFQAKQIQRDMNQKYNENLDRRGKSLPYEFYLPKPVK